MRIGELAAATGASVRSLRYYEDQGLLSPLRSQSGQRTYSHDAVQRVGLIQRLFDAGLCSKAMTELLPCITDPGKRTSELQARLLRERARLSNNIAVIERHRASLDHLIDELRTLST
ncbi:DNA-binding transcriptional MerR regulator [Pseudarthrobacter sp. PvP004]|jgi:DNA-binding transcriptional MerR regulator|uniref:Transcription regulator, MerR family n=1 Tax=Paenarthrobacter aurescens (strain TC1) TaxID=290340 RepID=A1RBN7_PAEAT|nr:MULTISPECIES: MerR family transcriptional regulator [Micrococcaceae]ABM07836.1 putative transcription regulator, MerR family [Paenarthrobacter aurescens TC1]MBP2268467.1 DNA-binding transcriptional MerR regulator [Pseudarthrobacter sp. PvP004]